ncbi:MAG: hypothetical protein ACXQTU_05005 [Candidatus Nezhaarchaeales archaeon]
MTKTSSSFFAFKKHMGISEIIAAIILFTITLTISSLSIAFLSQRANMASKSIASDVKRATIEALASIKLVDVVQLNTNETSIVLYNPSSMRINIVAIIAGNFSQKVNEVLEPISITSIILNTKGMTIPKNEIYILTSEGVLIHVKE